MRKFNKLILVTLLFVASLTIPQTYAYWSTVDYTDSVLDNTVLIGEWNQNTEWVSGVTYNINDVVTLNGVTYISTRANNTKTPGANGSAQWWSVI